MALGLHSKTLPRLHSGDWEAPEPASAKPNPAARTADSAVAPEKNKSLINSPIRPRAGFFYHQPISPPATTTASVIAKNRYQAAYCFLSSSLSFAFIRSLPFVESAEAATNKNS